MNHSEWKYIRRHIVKTALTVIFIIASILLIILVLMQEGKEAGLTGAADSGTYWSKNKGRSKEGTLIKVTTFFTIVFFVTAAILCSRFI
jgi:preprotein translocase subunit SecG